MKPIYLLLLLLLPFDGIGQVITTIVGGGTGGDGGQASDASIGPSCGLALDRSGNIFIADPNQQRIRKVDVSTGIISTIAGTGTGGYNGDGILATSAQLNLPVNVALDTVGNIYISDGINNRIRKVDVSTGIISTYAGNGTYGSAGDGGQATNAEIEANYIAFDIFGNLYIAENFRIRKVNLSGVIGTIAGTGVHGIAIDNVAATSSTINNPQGLCVDYVGNVYLTDSINSIRKITISTGVISRVAGKGNYVAFPYLGDGLPATASNIGPFGIAVNNAGNLLISDFANSRIEMVDGTGFIHTVAGNGTYGFSGDGGPATAAQIHESENVAIDICGNIYIADFGNSRIRKVTYPLCGYLDVPTEAQSAKLTLYPNPATEELHISAPGQISNMIIVNMVGQVVYKNTAISGQTLVVSTASLHAGIYFAKVYLQNGNVGVQRFVVE